MSASTQPSSSSPGALETFNLVVNAALAEVHTAVPGTIHTYDQALQTASVQLGFKRRYQGEEQAIDYPILTNVPVMFPAVAAGYLRLPVAAGDTGLVMFAERALDNWLLSGGSQDPEQGRRFNIADAVFIPGLATIGRQVWPKGSPTSVELSCGGTRLEITATGQVKVTNALGVDLLTVLDGLLTHLQTWTSINCVAGAPVTPSILTLADLVQDQLKLRSLM